MAQQHASHFSDTKNRESPRNDGITVEDKINRRSDQEVPRAEGFSQKV
jgi:hypothetical protein